MKDYHSSLIGLQNIISSFEDGGRVFPLFFGGEKETREGKSRGSLSFQYSKALQRGTLHRVGAEQDHGASAGQSEGWCWYNGKYVA